MCSNEDPGQPKINTFKKKKDLIVLKMFICRKRMIEIIQQSVNVW